MHVYNMRSPTWQNICEAQTLLCPLAFSFKVSLQSIVSSQKVTYMFTNMPLLFHLCSETYLFTESSHSSDGTHGSLTAILNWNWQKMSSVFFFFSNAVLRLFLFPSSIPSSPCPAPPTLQGLNRGLEPGTGSSTLNANDGFVIHWFLKAQVPPSDISNCSRVPSVGYFPCF